MLVEFFAVSGIINAVVALGFGLLVFLKNWRSKSGVLFLALTAALAFWGFSYWQWLTQTTAETALFWARLLGVGSVFIPLFFFHWVKTIFRASFPFVWVLYVLAVVIIAFSQTSLFVPTVSEKSIFPFWPDAGILYTAYFVVFYLGLVSYALFILFSAYFNKKNPDLRGQAFYIILGAVLGFGGGLTNFPLWWDVLILPFGTFLVVAFPFLLGYSVIKHRLFNLKAIAAELLIFFILIVLAIQTILSTTWLEGVLRGAFFLMVGVIGVLLIRSVYREVETRQQIEQLAENLKQANEKLKELDKLKSQFLSIASHDLRAPLSVIRNYISMIFEGTYGKVSPAMQEGLQQVFDRATDMAKSIDSYLNVSRIEQGKMKYEFIEVELAPLLKKSVTDFQTHAKEKGLDFTVSVTPSLEGRKARLDISKINEVLNNIIDNSIKYTPKGSIALNASVNGNVARIVIQDTGIGMSKETAGKLFKLFSTGEQSLKVNTSSTGVGLYITKAHVEAHGGRIWAESDGEGRGSRFIVELPLL